MAPSTTTGTRTRLLVGAGGGAATVGALAYIGIGNPHSPSFVFPSCPFNALTGWLCPACGGLRMTHDLLHGDQAAAFKGAAVKTQTVEAVVVELANGTKLLICPL